MSKLIGTQLALVSCAVGSLLSACTDPRPVETGEVQSAQTVYGVDCYASSVVDDGSSGGLHYFSFYGDFRCGHSDSTPSVTGDTCGGGIGVTYTGAYQMNITIDPSKLQQLGVCTVITSSWWNTFDWQITDWSYWQQYCSSHPCGYPYAGPNYPGNYPY